MDTKEYLSPQIQQDMTEFIRYLEYEKNASNSTMLSYERDLKKLFSFLGGRGVSRVQDMNATNLNAYILQMERDGFSSSSVSRSIASIRAFCRYLYKTKVLQEDPSEKLRAPHVEKKTPEILTTDEVKLLLDQPDTATPKGLRDKAMLELMYATGMRVSELISLQMDDVNMQMNYVVCRDNGKERVIPFGEKAAGALKDYLAGGRQMLLKEDGSQCFFTNYSGNGMSRQGFWKLLKQYSVQADITKDITPHTLRHSFGAHLVQNGADLRDVQEMMGHSDISTTQLYLDLNIKRMREAHRQTHPR